MIAGDDLKKYVEETVVHDLKLLRRMKVPVNMPAKLSEPLICHLMGWTWVKGNSKHDALDGKKRIQIKYAKKGAVSLTEDDLNHWDLLAWVHAPERLPKVLLLIPTSKLKNVPLNGKFFNYSALRNHALLNTVEAKRFHLNSPEDILEAVKLFSKINIDTALNEIDTDLKPNSRKA